MSMPPPAAPPAYGPPGAPPMYGPPTKPQTMKPMIAGILLVVAGVMAIIVWALIFTNPLTFFLAAFLPGLVVICGAIAFALSILTLLGGVMALRRRMWGLALVGSILGLFIIGPFGVSSLLAFVGLIILAISRKEF